MLSVLVLLFFGVATAADRRHHGFVGTTINGDLILTPRMGKAVIISGLDVPAAHANLTARLAALEGRLGLLFTPANNGTEPVEAFCWCTATDCTPAVRFASGNVTCCASANALHECHWIGSSNQKADCETVLMEGGPRNVSFPIHGFNSAKVGLAHVRVFFGLGLVAVASSFFFIIFLFLPLLLPCGHWARGTLTVFDLRGMAVDDCCGPNCPCFSSCWIRRVPYLCSLFFPHPVGGL